MSARAERAVIGDAAGARAVFLDRDGVITEPIYNPATGEYESPHTLADLVLCPGIFAPLRALAGAGFALFIVSNQPSYAKGKTSLENIREIAGAVEAKCAAQGIAFREAYYCYHHPRGIVPGYSGPCDCRKPAPGFLLQAQARHGIDLARSWMIGDRGTDVECGQRAGCRTVLVAHRHAAAYRDGAAPDDVAADLAEAAQRILAGETGGRDHANAR